MTQYSTNSDFSTDAAGTAAHGTATTAITGYTHLRPLGTFSNLFATTITADGGAEGGKLARIEDTGYGTAPQILAMDGPGDIAANTETEILFRFRISQAPTDSGIGRIRYDNTNLDYYSFNTPSNGNLQLIYWQGVNGAGSVGSAIAKNITADVWYWARIHVTAAHVWRWRVWSGDFSSEPGTWDVEDITHSSQTSGYVGIGLTYTATQPVDYDWFSAATGGDSAPGPAGAADETAQPSTATVSVETEAPTLLRDITRAAGATATVTAETDAPNVFALATPAAADIDVTTGTLTLNGTATLNPGEANVSVAVAAPTVQPSVDIATAEILASGTQIQLTTNEEITAAINDGGGSDFTLTMSGGAVTMAYHSGLPGTTHLYNLSRTISSDETGTLDYTQPGNGLEATSDGEDVRSVTALVVDNGSTVSGRTATAGAEVGAPGDAITFALVGFSGAPTGATVNGVAATIQNATQTMVDVVLPALSTFVQGGAHETTEWNTTITVVVSEAGGSASDTLQIVSPDTDGPTYWFGTCALVDGTFPSPSSVLPPQAVVGDEYFVEVQTGAVTNVLANGSIQASTSTAKVTSRIWDESANSGAGGWSLTRQVQFYAMDSLIAQHRNRRWAFKRV